MLSEDLKDGIRCAYAALMESRGLTPRWGQRQMIAEIANALARIPGPGEPRPARPPVCVIEAGTGTGKTIAYAIAAIPLARARGKRLVVCTATIALQEQFVFKDLPDIRHHSGLEFSYALAKGRRRYVCLSKLDRQLAQGGEGSALLPLYPEELAAPAPADALPLYGAMLEALGRGQWDGDRDNWPGSLPEEVWFGVTTDHAQCSGRRCPNVRQCSFFRAREALQGADVIVANHDLALADLALGGGAILPAPEDCIYVFDEGHHLPDKALAHFASFCRLHTTIQWLRESRDLLVQGANQLSPLDALRHPLQALPAAMDDVAAALQVAERDVAALVQAEPVQERREEQVLRFELGRVPADLQQAAATLAGGFRQLVAGLAGMESTLEQALEDEFAGLDREAVETWHLNVGGMLGRAEGALALWQAYAAGGEGEDPPRARWVRLLGGNGPVGFELRCSPILAADILGEHLWSRAAGVVVTSATLTALNSFERFIIHAGAPRDASYKVVASPFDYANALFRVPPMDCDPGDAPAHTAALIDMLPGLLDPTAGSLVLFSSRRQMLEVYEGLDSALRERILLQGDYGKAEILRRHRKAVDEVGGSVIFGLASFAEGVDLPGDYCRHVVIAKIPFAVPDSPLEAALAEWIESRGRNAFMEISVPDAALRLVQACGRLLRTETDGGTVTLLDRRIVTRRYGRAMLDSLPPFRRELA